MSQFPSQHTYAANEALTAANLNTHSNGIAWLTQKKPSVFAYQNSLTTSCGNTAWTTIVCDTVLVDTESGYNTSTGIYTAPVAGYYLCNGGVCFATNGNGSRAIRFNSTGGVAPGIESTAGSGAVNIDICISVIVKLTANQQVWLQAYQDSGGDLATTINTANNRAEQSFFDATWIRGI